MNDGRGRPRARRARARATAGSFVFLAAAPGVVAGLAPWLLTRWRADGGVPLALRLLGLVPIALGSAVLLAAFARFVREGLGTPAPVAPTEHLVVGGLYRWVRNPMYLAVEAVVLGQALLLARPLVAYAAGAGLLMAAFARLHEEPRLAHRYGAAYEDYRGAVPGWLPRRPR